MFGSVQSRGCPLLGIHGTPDLEAHEQRFLQNGWHTACARDMNAVYTKHIDPADRQRSANCLLCLARSRQSPDGVTCFSQQTLQNVSVLEYMLLHLSGPSGLVEGQCSVPLDLCRALGRQTDSQSFESSSAGVHVMVSIAYSP